MTCLSTIIIAAITGLLSLTMSAQDNQDEAKRFYRIGLAALEENDLEIASSNLAKAAALAPSNALIKYNLGIVLSMANDNEGARANLEAAIKLGLDAKAKDAAEILLAKVTYKLEKAASFASLASQIQETWKEQVVQGGTFLGPEGENLRWEYATTGVVFDACTVTFSYTRTQFKKGQGRNDKWVPIKSLGQIFNPVLMSSVTSLELGQPSDLIIIDLPIKDSTGAIRKGAKGIPNAGGTRRLIELLTAFAKACNAPLGR